MKKYVIITVLLLSVLACLVFFYSKKETENGENIINDIFENPTKTKFTTFPVKIEDFQTPPKMYGLWPYGVKGNNSSSHNEGHPGWDFELKKGSKIYAIADLRIAQIHDGDHQTEDGEVPKVIEAYANLGGENIHIVYHSVKNIEPNVKEGANVKEGSILAEVGFPLSEESAMIHFGIFGPKDSVGTCPSDFFDEAFDEIIRQMVANSIDMNTEKPYTSECVGKINKEIYYKNYPDNIKYLQGGEQWE